MVPFSVYFHIANCSEVEELVCFIGCLLKHSCAELVMLKNICWLDFSVFLPSSIKFRPLQKINFELILI